MKKLTSGSTKALFNFKLLILYHKYRETSFTLGYRLGLFLKSENPFCTFINVLPTRAAAPAVGYSQSVWKRKAAT